MLYCTVNKYRSPAKSGLAGLLLQAAQMPTAASLLYLNIFINTAKDHFTGLVLILVGIVMFI